MILFILVQELSMSTWEYEIAKVLFKEDAHTEKEKEALKRRVKCTVFAEVNVYHTGQGLINTRASRLAQQLIRGKAIVVFGGSKGKSLYSLLRPEFVKQNPQPLSSDAWTLFGIHDRREHNTEVGNAVSRMRAETIPQFVKQLEERRIIPLHPEDLRDQMHSRGINMRYLGLVRSLVTKSDLKKLILMYVQSGTA